MGLAKREWGNKHTCVACGAKFYDLHRRPIECPKCGTVVEVEDRAAESAPPAGAAGTAATTDAARQ